MRTLLLFFPAFFGEGCSTPHGSFHGDYDGHDVVADCTLQTNVLCSVSIDGEPAGEGSRGGR